MREREWIKGDPPHVGWWNASDTRVHDAWRWWNGEYWSAVVFSGGDLYSREEINHLARVKNLGSIFPVEYTNHWPKNARVKRVNPEA